MEKKLKEIKEILAYHGKLLEGIYEMIDSGQKQRAAAIPDLKAVMDMIGSHPTIKNNPAMSGMLKNMFSKPGGSNGN